jgi:Fatty acid desaturase
VILAHLVPLAILAVAGILGGLNGMVAIFLAGVIGRSFDELINYVQHYGLVRVENTPIRPHHSWDCYRTISNAVHYNLPRHSDHHMFATKAALAVEYPRRRSHFALWVSEHGLHRADAAALAAHHEARAR